MRISSRIIAEPLVALCVIALSACTNGTGPGKGSQQAGRPVGLKDTVVVGTASGVTVLRPGSTDRSVPGPAAPALGDWSRVFDTTHEGGSTILHAMDTSTGAARSVARIPGNLEIRTVSADGRLAALMTPLAPGESAWEPTPRSTTSITVADTSGVDSPRTFHLKGNFAPEAFDAADSTLFVIEYVPPTDPTGYRVAGISLVGGEVFDVPGRLKSPSPGVMNGERLMQTPSPDAKTLYTLYSRQPSEYAKGYDPMQAHADRQVAFVHTLSLDEGWAVCVPLPKALWAGRPTNEALATSPDGSSLYVVDIARGIVAVMDTDRLDVRRTARVDLSALGEGQAEATVSPDGTALFVSAGSGIARVNASSLTTSATWSTTGDVSGLGLSSDGLRLYASVPGRIEVLDPTNGRLLQAFPTPGVDGIRSVVGLAA